MNTFAYLTFYIYFNHFFGLIQPEIGSEIVQHILTRVPVAQWLEHCVSSAKVVGSIDNTNV